MKTSTQRKQAQRQRDKEAGMCEIRLQVTTQHKERIEQAAKLSGWDLGELLALLGHRYAEKVEKAAESLKGQVCDKCGEPKSLESKCAFKGMSDCWMTAERKELLGIEV